MKPEELATTLGLAVFACHYIVVNGSTRCSCVNPDCRDPGKHPYPRHSPNGFKNASKDPQVIRRWSSGPYNIGIATGAVSGIVVVDVDPRNGGDKSLASLEAEHGAFPSTWRAFTGGGGEHIYFAHPGGYIERADFAPGINLKGDGGYVIAPPSQHISGRRYAWNVDRHPQHTALAPAPQWIIDRATARNQDDKPKVNWKAFAAAPFSEGDRHNAITRLAGLLFFRMWREPHLAAQLLLAFNESRCTPPLEASEVIAIIDWAAAREVERRCAAR